jgi:cytochrome P450
MLTRYTGIGEQHGLSTAAVRIDLTRNISKVISDLQDEIAYALDREIGISLQEWTKIHVRDRMLQIVGLMSARTFVGLPLSRDKEWTDTTINYTVDVVKAVNALRRRSSLAATLLSSFMPEVRRVLSYRELAVHKLKPQVDKILAARSKILAACEDSKGAGQGRDDNSGIFSLTHWLLNRVPDVSAANATKLAEIQLILSFVAIHTTSVALSHALLDLAAHPECVVQLRAEIEDVLHEDGCADGVLGKATLQKLVKLDSFIKESQRMNPFSMST